MWQIVNSIDTQKAKDVPLWVRTPFLEAQGLFNNSFMEEMAQIPPEHVNDKLKSMIGSMVNSIKLADELPSSSPRVIKSHLPFEMLPPKLLDTCKVFFVCRNPKDACVSFYNHYNNLPDYKYKGNFEQFAQMFLDGTVEYGGYWTMLKVHIYH
jgi:hypothetical protein